MLHKRILLATLLFLLAGCSGLPRHVTPTVAVTPTPPAPPATQYATPTAAVAPTSPAPRIVENAGEICFHTYNAETGTLEGIFYPEGCYSSSCTRILEQTAHATWNEQAREIHIESRFVLLDTTVRFPEPRTCNADCGGGGEVSLVLEGLKGNSYRVVLGATTLGVLQLSEVNPRGLCLGSRS
jgi:hypothetical protein